jgi:hypothetical protein
MKCTSGASPRFPGHKAKTLVLVRRFGLAAATLLLAAACSGGGEAATPEPTATAPALEPTPTTEPVVEPTATEIPEPTATVVPADPDAAQAAWSNFWQAISVPDDNAFGLAAALEWGSQEAIDGVRSFPWGSTDREVENFPVLEAAEGGSFAVNDCMFFTPGFGSSTVWWQGTVELVDGSWSVTSATRVNGFDPCVPAELADEAIAGYEAYLDAVPVFWDPPDADDPLLAQTMTGNHLAVIADQVVRASGEGWVVRGRQSSHPEVISSLTSSEVVLLDCYEVDPNSGAFDAVTGERLDELIAPVRPGQLNKSAVEMIREEGQWKVKGINSVLNDNCDLAPTSDGLPVV